MANLALIRQLCDEKNISIRELSRRVERRESTIQGMIRNGSTSTLTLEAIAEVLGVSPGIFWEDKQSQAEKDMELDYLRKLVMEKDQVIKEKERMIGYLMAEKTIQ